MKEQSGYVYTGFQHDELGRKKNKNNVFKLKEEDGKCLTDPLVLSDTLNKWAYFCSVGNNLQKKKIVIMYHSRVFFPSLQGTVCFVHQ